MSDAELRKQMEDILRIPAEFIYDATIINISADHVFIVPAGSKTVKRDVRLAEHIKRELLFVGMKVKAHDIRGKPYIVAIFDTGQSALKLAGMPLVEEDEGGLPPGQDLLMFPLPDVSGTCDGWTITWPAVQGATSYVIYWAEDAEGLNAAELGTTEELIYEAALDTADPPKGYFALQAINANKESAISPYLTDESSAAFQIPGGFTVCPVGSGYRIDVDPEIDLTADALDYDHWELEWADDEEGLNGAKWGDVVPADLPLIISSTAPGQWTFDTDTDETWGHLHGASPDEWDADGNTAAGSRIIYDGGGTVNPDAGDPVYGGRIEQAMPQFTGVATDSVTFFIKVVGSGTPHVKVRLDPGTYITVPVETADGSVIDEYQAQSYARPPYTYTEFEATGDWQECTISMPAEAVGQPIGFIGIKVTVTGGAVSQILADDIVWGPGGVQPATQKWFRLRAASCMGLFGPYTDWLSGWSEQIIFEEPHNHGTVHTTDLRYRFRVGDGYIERSDDSGVTYTDITADIPDPISPDGIDPPLTAADLNYIQVLHDPNNPATFYFLARYQETPASPYYGWVLKTTDMGVEDWTWYVTVFDEVFVEACAGWDFDVGSPLGEPADQFATWELDDTALTLAGWGAGVVPYWWGVADGYLIILPIAGSLPSGGTVFTGTVGMAGNCNIRLGDESVFRTHTSGPPRGWSLAVKFADGETVWWGADSEIRGGFPIGPWNLFPTYTGRTIVKFYIGFSIGNQNFHDIYIPWVCFDNVYIPSLAPAPALHLWMDLNSTGEELAITMVKNDVLEVHTFNAETMVETKMVPAGTHLLAEVVDGLWWAGPRWLADDQLLLYGRMQAEDETVIQVQAILENDQLLPLIDETIWAVEDFAGGLVVTDDSQVLVVRHGGSRFSLTTLAADSLTYTLISGDEEVMKVGATLLNVTKNSSRLITAVDLDLDTVEFDAPLVETWEVLDELIVQGTAELQTFPAADLTMIIEPEVLSALTFCINPGAIDVGELGGLMLGNRLDEETMVVKLELPYDLETDVSADFTVAAPIVALKWSESGCLPAMIDDQAGTDENGNPVLPPLPPPSGDSGGEVPVAPSPGDPVQSPGWRKLKHHELLELTDDDHPQYHNDARGDVRYYTKTQLQTSGDAQVHWDNVISEPASFPAGGDAGGVLSGTYPDPGFAVDMATEAELGAHVDDTTGAHAASAISLNTAAFDGNLSAADDTVQKAMETLDEMTAGMGDVAGEIHAAAEKTTPVDADELGLVDSADSWSLKKLTWANLKATAKAYFDTLYAALVHAHDDLYYTETEFDTTLDLAMVTRVYEPETLDVAWSVDEDKRWQGGPLGTFSPFVVNSNVMNAQLNADLLDDKHAVDLTRIWPAEGEFIGQDGTKYASLSALIAGLSNYEVGYIGPGLVAADTTIAKPITLIGPGIGGFTLDGKLTIDTNAGNVYIKGLSVITDPGDVTNNILVNSGATLWLDDVESNGYNDVGGFAALEIASGGFAIISGTCKLTGEGTPSGADLAISSGGAAIINGPVMGNATVTNSGSLYGYWRNLNGEIIHVSDSKTTPVDADSVFISDNADANVLKKTTWANIKATLKTYFDTLYSLAAHTHGLNTTTVSKLVASDGSPDSLTSDAAGALTVGVSLKLPGSAQVVDDIDTAIADDDTALATSGAVFDAISNIMKGYAEATSTTINSTGAWTTINGMSVTATINKGEALVIIQVHGYQSPAGAINWQIRALLDGATASSGAPQNYSTGSLANVVTNVLIERFTGLSVASHTFVAQAILNTASVSVVFADANTRNCSITVLEL